MKNPSVFVSYSWDSPSHEEWVFKLTNDLRDNGIDAKFDKTLTQGKTVNLNQMMISGIRDFDNIVIVLTENYAKRADALTGGVGFENFLITNQLMSDINKFIPIVRHNGDYKAVFPFHLTGIYAIDFTNDQNYGESIRELLHRVLGVPLFEEKPLGKIPHLTPKKSLSGGPIQASTGSAQGINIPKLKRITDFDKDNFLTKSFSEMSNMLATNLKETKRQNDSFEFTYEQIHSRKVMAVLYIDGKARTGIKMWLGSWASYSSQSINISYGTSFSSENDSGFNESISCEASQDGNLQLHMVMGNFRSGSNPADATSVFREIWEQLVSNLR